MVKAQKRKGFTLVWEAADRAKLAALMAAFQSTTRDRVTQSSALLRAVDMALESVQPSQSAQPVSIGTNHNY